MLDIPDRWYIVPTAAGVYRIAQMGLDALYPDNYPVRSKIEVLAAGVAGRCHLWGHESAHLVRDRYSARRRLGGLAAGYDDHQNMLRIDAFDPNNAEPTFCFRRTDMVKTVEVTYHVSDVPNDGPALGHLQQIIDETASEEDGELFVEAWHGRVRESSIRRPDVYSYNR